mgnify:CR=1 FL=1
MGRKKLYIMERHQNNTYDVYTSWNIVGQGVISITAKIKREKIEELVNSKEYRKFINKLESLLQE